jgi:predicted acetyltransferase
LRAPSHGTALPLVGEVRQDPRMTPAAAPGPPAHVTLVPADPAQRPVVERLAQLERHDLSELMGWLPDDAGLFEVPRLDRFFTDSDHQALLIRADGALAGFCLVRPIEDGVSFIHSFLVLRGLRRHGVGRAAAAELLHRRRGRWAIAFLEQYEEAGGFWRAVARDVAGSDWTEGRRTSPDGEHLFAWIEIDLTPA